MLTETYVALIDSAAQTILGTEPARLIMIGADAEGPYFGMNLDVPIDRKGRATHAIVVHEGAPWSVMPLSSGIKVRRGSDLTLSMKWHMVPLDGVQLPAAGMLPPGKIEIGAGA